MSFTESPIISLTCFLALAMFFFMGIIAAALRVVPENKRMDVYRLGRYIGEKGPGLILLIPAIDRGTLKDVHASLGAAGGLASGAIGEAKTQVFTDGSVEIAGQRWDAVSERPIAPGARVRVRRVRVEVEEF